MLRLTGSLERNRGFGGATGSSAWSLTVAGQRAEGGARSRSPLARPPAREDEAKAPAGQTTTARPSTLDLLTAVSYPLEHARAIQESGSKRNVSSAHPSTHRQGERRPRTALGAAMPSPSTPAQLPTCLLRPSYLTQPTQILHRARTPHRSRRPLDERDRGPSACRPRPLSTQ